MAKAIGIAETSGKDAPKGRDNVVNVPAPNIREAKFHVIGTAPLVVHRFSHKTKQAMITKMELGSAARKGQKRDPLNLDDSYNEARYISKDGWDGFNAAAVRNSLISACRLVGFRMTLAKLSVFVVPDGWDKKEPEIPLIKIIGAPRRLESRANVETGQAYITIRPCYDQWEADITIRYDADQFGVADIANLLSRVGTQVGWCEGRPDSKNSAGMGWGTFILQDKERK